MKKIILTAVLAALLFNCKGPEKNEYNKNEIIFVVEMESNDSKSDNDIAEFSKYYTEAIDNNDVLKNEIAENEQVQSLIETAINIEGLNRHVSTHAAGLVIGDKPLH